MKKAIKRNGIVRDKTDNKVNAELGKELRRNNGVMSWGVVDHIDDVLEFPLGDIVDETVHTLISTDILRL